MKEQKSKNIFIINYKIYLENLETLCDCAEEQNKIEQSEIKNKEIIKIKQVIKFLKNLPTYICMTLLIGGLISTLIYIIFRISIALL